ncbi:MAG: hypothetical protein Q8N23_15610 [Archangium sp.]|nr:hypothetical protein [Archangium sp.]MDP3569995.1 hypothetical protein [Archangium sp.]
MSRSSLKGFSAFAVLTVFAAGCERCGDPPVVPVNQCSSVPGAQSDRPNACSDNADCGDHFACKEVKDTAVKCCVFNDRACTTEADCCPGQTCPADRKKCFDKFIGCQQDSECGDRGDRVCEVYTDTYGTSSRCRFRTCGPLGECAAGQSCFQGECMADLPCLGACPPGKGCVATIDRCQDYSMPTDRPAAACPMTCTAGFIATFKEPRNIWDSCVLPNVACVCAELPGLNSNDLGRFSSISADPANALFVSAYDGQYGDLVVVKYGLDGKKLSTEYVDGVPSAAVKYGPSGARGGIVEPGPDVGRYTDVAVSQGRVYVSYYDVTGGNLKVAMRNTSGVWSKHQVDGAQADLGLYTSIAIDSDGLPGVSYFQRGGDSTFNAMDCPTPRPTGATKYITALKFARATSATPSSEGDWSIKTIACASRPPPICDACNGICADPGTGPACLTAGSSCTGCNASTESCVSVNGADVCAKNFTPPDLQQVLPGVGLFTSLAFKNKEAVIAYMRRTVPTMGAADGDLFAVTVSGTGTVGTPVLIDGSGDTGYFPDVKVEAQTMSVGIGYHDFSSKAFKFYFAPQLQAGVTPEVIDRGVDATMAGNQGWVGTDSAIVFGPSGVVWALYQDATRGDLKLAKRTSSWTVQTSPRTEGAVGFFADALFTDGKLFASHARIHAKLVQSEPQVDNSLLLEALPGN